MSSINMMSSLWNRTMGKQVTPYLYFASRQYSSKVRVHFDRSVTAKRGGEIAESDIEDGRKFIKNAEKLMVITGAGVSTDSGIIDSQALKEKKFDQLKLSRNSEDNWKIYWAQSFFIWPLMQDVKPNRCHEILREMEQKDSFQMLFTKNVDNLHFKAESEKVTEMHGNVRSVICSNCSKEVCRQKLQNEMEKKNGLNLNFILEMQPTGSLSGINVNYTDDQLKEINRLQAPECRYCEHGKLLKPNVVLYDMNKEVKKSFEYNLGKADSILILGTSLTDNFVPKQLKDQLKKTSNRKQVLMVNLGTNEKSANIQSFLKGDGFKCIEANCAQFLEKVVLDS